MVDSWDATHPGQARVSKGRALKREQPKSERKTLNVTKHVFVWLTFFGDMMILFFKKHWNLLKNFAPETLTSTQNFHLLKNKILIQLTHIAMAQRLWSWALGNMVLWDASGPAIVMSSRVPWPRGGSKVGYKGQTIDKVCQSHSETSPGYHEWIAINNLL